MNPLIDAAVLFLGHELTRQGIEVKFEPDTASPAVFSLKYAHRCR